MAIAAPPNWTDCAIQSLGSNDRPTNRPMRRRRLMTVPPSQSAHSLFPFRCKNAIFHINDRKSCGDQITRFRRRPDFVAPHRRVSPRKLR